MNKIFTRISTILLTLLFMWSGSYAQTITAVRGKVTDSKDKQSIIGASVVEIDKDRRTVNGVVTDIDGNFVLRISNPNNKIMVSFIGYVTQKEISINGRAVINVQLVPSTNSLDDVTVVARRKTNNGTGMNVDDRDRTTAIVSIDAKVLEEMQAGSIDQALQGRLSGVDIAATSGDPGAGMSIRIRGTSSLNGATEPLIVVDGMPYETAVPEGFNFATADDQGYAQLLNIAPSDIKDISVLKDAAATALWGSRGSNGVLIINTKRGSIGKPQISYTFKGSLSQQPSAIPMLTGDQYSMLIPEEFMNRNGVPLNTQTVKEFQYDPQDLYWYKNYSNNTDWISAISRTGNLQDHNVSISGGGEKARYFASLGYFGQQGTTIGTDLSRITTRINLDYNVSNRLRFRTDFAYTHVSNNQLYSNVRDVAYSKMPNMSIMEYNDYGLLTPNYFSPASNIQGYFYFDDKNAIKGTYNPVAMAMAATNRSLGDRIIPHFNLQFDIVKDLLMATTDVVFDINTQKTSTFLPQIATGRPFTEITVNRATDLDYDVFNVGTKTNLLFTPHLNDKHKFQALMSFQTADNRYVNQNVMNANTASSLFQDPSIPGRTQNDQIKLGSVQTQYRTVAGLVNANYGFLDRYFISGSLRVDGNSRFGENNRFGLFPSISGRYRFSGEHFMERFKFIDDLSFRLSYAQSGNAPKKDYTFYNTYGNFDWSYMGLSGVYTQNMELTNLKWETVHGLNYGLSFALFNSRVVGDVDIYRNRTKDLFLPGLRLATYTGFDAVDMNIGTMDNQGWEFNINTQVVKSKKWRVDFSFNIAQNQNMIREISPLYPTENKAKINENGKFKQFLQINNPFGSFYGFKFQGVYKDKEETVAKDKNGAPILDPNGNKVYMRFNYPGTDYIFQPGDAKYEDINHDGTIDYKDIVYLGNSNPKFTGGFGPSITFNGNIKLSAFFSYRTGYQLINGTKMNTTNMSGYGNQSTAVLRRWRNEGDVTDVPRALYGSGYNWLGSSRYVEDGSYLKWRTITLRYDFDKKILKRFKLNALSIYGTGENLITFTKYLGQDPEVGTKITDAFSIAIDNSMTPPPKVFTIGISTRF
ncbi:MAG: SusC/RagA family TonB-linked outer membrane protein [Candidatus Pedobacter colombiensis]|uniref:SusC/RagA family TonB-linked outer membrane protein n=1 Tax=Candidatus Pedobacter colombiensis TaxID=3121371 RepID=A0AAJ5WAP4_9SPHI|nr:SusC/RagA family TonB-linked outer membrane protein [Pedobacter sp.]WEK20171.1 MAG: SusC/RagA family TonB-linked outer membrane protein [Pedobacter sp.]